MHHLVQPDYRRTPRQQTLRSGSPIHKERVRADVAPAYEHSVNSSPLDYRIPLLRSGRRDNEDAAQCQKARCQFMSKSLNYFSTSRRYGSLHQLTNQSRVLAEPRVDRGVNTTPLFENIGLMVRSNLHRNSKGGVEVEYPELFWWFDSTESLKLLSGKLEKFVPRDVRFKAKMLQIRFLLGLREMDGKEEVEKGIGGREWEREGEGRRVPLPLQSDFEPLTPTFKNLTPSLTRRFK